MRSADPSKAEAVGGRIRFQAPRKRFKALRDEAATTSRHDTVALVEGEEGYALALGDQSKSRDACLLKAELERLGGLEKRSEYKERYQTPLWPLCQSLPEVVVNVDKIASLLGEAFGDAPLPSVFSLASVLARDAGPALSKDSLDVLVHGLVQAVSSKDADTASAAARALDYVFKYCSSHLLEAVWKSTSELGHLRGPCESPRHRADAATETSSYGDNIASMAWGARNLISTQVGRPRGDRLAVSL